MKKFYLTTLIVLIVVFVFQVIVVADQREDVFKSQGCIACHRPGSRSKVNPSLAEIVKAYQGKEALLLSYLRGESEAIVRPEKARLMKRYVEKTKALTDAERQTLVDFIMHHKFE
jgi:cytochrome c